MFSNKSKLLLAAAAGAFMTVATAANASSDFNCDEHASHIDHEVGVEKALEAFHVLHGDKSDDKHVVEALKKEHPEIETELEAYVAKGCGEAELTAHKDD